MKSPVKKRFPLDLTQYTLRMSRHAQKMATEKNFSMDTIQNTYNNPVRVYPSGSHPGQFRITGNGLCLVGLPETVEQEIETPKEEFKMVEVDGVSIPFP